MKTIRQLVTILVILACAIPAAASRLETVKVESESMHKQIDVSVVLPDSYGARPLPVSICSMVMATTTFLDISAIPMCASMPICLTLFW